MSGSYKFCNSEDPSIIEFIHDVGAGGLSNAIPELAKDSNHGVFIHLEKIPCADESMSPWKSGQMNLKKDM